MKKFASALLAIACLTGSSYADIGFYLGPFSLELGGRGDAPTFAIDARDTYPICRAIDEQNLLNLIVRVREKVSDKEFKITVKKITLEPYLFGRNNRRQHLLKGKITNEAVVKEVTVKYGEEADNAEGRALPGTFKIQNEGSISTVNVDQILEISILPDTHFDIPKDYDKDAYNDVVDVICEIDANA
ncbi:hypothetical protein [Estrella lausannensis]|uniref:Putative secreted protein n=1 Tax=Estrella lausannensis TaxID=483423 RepID=A0A0H5DQQ6_9BACT|nr:hypothetical protein [Estrella lausannensis]CRX37924.1 putative secreted protein [Estrella lausannensis]